jgi:tRNA dimethylallyltransferase
MNKLLIIIQGPTASGKTALSISLSKKLKTVIFSADSRQFYKELSIGTAKPTQEEQDGVTHYFVNSHSIHDRVTAASYVSEILPLIEHEFLSRDVLILVGGSGMYIDALCYGLDDLPVNEVVKNDLINEFKQFGLESLSYELKQKDPEYFAKVDKNNSVRIIRALEVIRISGKPFSSYLSNTKNNKNNFGFVKFTIDLNRDYLYDRINRRVDQMIIDGLEEEVRSLVDYKELQALQTVGYGEWFDFFENKVTKVETIEKIKQNTRRYAKRQLTWFRRDQSAVWLKGQNLDSQLDEVLNYLKLNKYDY